jgi:hypothetical protein
LGLYLRRKPNLYSHGKATNHKIKNVRNNEMKLARRNKSYKGGRKYNDHENII